MNHIWEYQGQFSGGHFMYKCTRCGASLGVKRGQEESIEDAMVREQTPVECIPGKES